MTLWVLDSSGSKSDSARFVKCFGRTVNATDGPVHANWVNSEPNYRSVLNRGPVPVLWCFGVLSGVTRNNERGLQMRIDSVRMLSLSNWRSDHDSRARLTSQTLSLLRHHVLLHPRIPSRRTSGSQFPSKFFFIL